MDPTLNNVDVETPDAPTLKHEVEELIEKEQAGTEDEGVTPEATPEPEVPNWEEQYQTLKAESEAQMEKFNHLESRYESSSTEGKRLSGELERLKGQDEYLRSNYDLGPLLEGYQYEEPVAPEEQPVTRADLERWQIENEWLGAERDFFGHSDNKDVSENPMMKAMVQRWIWDDGGGLLRYPEATAKQAFSLAAAEVRNAMAGERLKGKEEARMTKQQLDQAAIVEGESAQPTVTDNTETDDTSDAETSYISVHRKQQERTRGGMS